MPAAPPPSSSPPTLLVATRNPGKLREYRQLLAGYPAPIISLDDLGITHEVPETGTTFAANARLKAETYCRMSGCLTISDDSGLEVHALGGAPGIYSARYGGHACPSDADRVQLLLHNLDGIPWPRRIARFRCLTAIARPPADPDSDRDDDIDRPPRITTVAGAIAGMIQYEPAGQHGFGYDPVFYLPSFGQTMAQLPPALKNRISHRGDAMRRARRILDSL